LLSPKTRLERGYILVILSAGLMLVCPNISYKFVKLTTSMFLMLLKSDFAYVIYMTCRSARHNIFMPSDPQITELCHLQLCVEVLAGLLATFCNKSLVLR